MFTVRPDGSWLTNVTPKVGLTGEGGSAGSRLLVRSWCPDGGLILFLDGHDGLEGQHERLATMRQDGSQRRFVSATEDVERQPD